MYQFVQRSSSRSLEAPAGRAARRSALDRAGAGWLAARPPGRSNEGRSLSFGRARVVLRPTARREGCRGGEGRRRRLRRGAEYESRLAPGHVYPASCRLATAEDQPPAADRLGVAANSGYRRDDGRPTEACLPRRFDKRCGPGRSARPRLTPARMENPNRDHPGPELLLLSLACDPTLAAAESGRPGTHRRHAAKVERRRRCRRLQRCSA